MRPAPVRTRSVLAVVLVAVALGVGGGAPSGAHRLIVAESAGVSGGTAPAGALEAVLRTETDRAESALTGTSASGARLLVLLAAPLLGLAMLLILAARRPSLSPGGLPSLTRLRQWVGLRAPPSSPLVSLPH
jgi:hypothetical protein